MDYLIDFVEKCSCFDESDKLKLILFASGAKPSAFVALKITPANLGDKFHFEKHLREKGFLFSVGSPKSFEEISAVKENKIIWSIKGTWYGYDLFRSQRYKEVFRDYIHYLRKQNHEKADISAGVLYGYPTCCIKSFIREHDLEFVKKEYSYYQYYKKIQDARKKFPFVFHAPCSLDCRETGKLNSFYRSVVKKFAPKFFREFMKKKSFNADLIVESENNITNSDGNNLWIDKDAHNYTLITKSLVNSHHYLFPFLTKDAYARGSLLSGRIMIQCGQAEVKIKKFGKVVPNLMHIRKFKLLGRDY